MKTDGQENRRTDRWTDRVRKRQEGVKERKIGEIQGVEIDGAK